MVSIPVLIDLFIYLPKGSTYPYMNSRGCVNSVILAISVAFINPKMYELLIKPNSVRIQTQFNRDYINKIKRGSVAERSKAPV